MKRLHTQSQNFLRSPQFVKKLLSYTTVGKNDTVLDIGAGSGVISSVLANVARSVVAVESDARLVQKLRENIGDKPNVTIWHGDVLKLQLPREPYKVFANIPFSLSSPIVQRFTSAPRPPSAMYLIVQEQFARKLLPDNKGYTNQLGIVLGVAFAVRIRQRLRSEDFYPRPNVPTVFVEILLRKEPLLPQKQQAVFYQFVTAAFTDPRKLWGAPLHAVGLPALASPSRLTLMQWIALFTYMQHNPRARGLSILESGMTLSQKAAPVAMNEFTSPSLRFVVDRLRAQVGSSNIALAAPRIGVAKRIIAISDSGRSSLVLVNPLVRGRTITGQDHTGKPLKLQPTGRMFDALLREIASLDTNS